MKKQPRKETYYGHEVWINTTTEALRKSECLCLNCGNLKPGQPDNCPVAQSLYEICVKNNVAMAITRCPLWKPKVKMVLHHDDPPCTARLLDNGFCPECEFVPDMQSTCFYFYCPSCDIPLKNLKCQKCKQVFKRPCR